MESFPDLGVSCVVLRGEGWGCGCVEGVVWRVFGDELFNHCSFFVRVLLCCGLDGGLMI